ncbi:MAG: phosphatidylglycerophosphatase A [Balneolaceae bacterium]
MRQFKILLGTLFGAGYLPRAPGTWGSLFTLPFIYLFYWVSPQYGLPLFLLITIILSLWTTSECVGKFGKDPPSFVMDEAAGQTVVFMATAFHFTLLPDLIILLTGFLLFRAFDIIKPLGIDKLEEIKGKYGILADDLMAGFYALIFLEGSILMYQLLPL